MTKRKSIRNDSAKWGDTWSPEITALSFGTLVFFGLIILLARSEGVTTDKWHAISINTLVAILSTLGRASLVFALASSIGQGKWILFRRSDRYLYDMERVDMASRDLLGRLQLLAAWPVGIVSIGALGAILALAFDPFMQQMIHIEPRVTFLLNPAAQIARATRYSQGLYLQQGGYYPASCTDNNDGPLRSGWLQDRLAPAIAADLGIQAAVLTGLQQPNATQAMRKFPFSCPSGNCTWTPFDSLSVCSQCLDISSKVQRSPSPAPNATFFTLPNGATLFNDNGWTMDDTLAASTASFKALDNESRPYVVATSFGTGNISLTNEFQNLSTLIWSSSLLNVKFGVNPKPWPEQPIQATECALYYCIKRYTPRATEGILSEQEETLPDLARDANSWQLTTKDGVSAYPTLSPAQAQSLQYGECLSLQPRTDLSFGKTYNISQDAVYSISSYINQTFTSGNTRDFTANKIPVNGYLMLKTRVGLVWEPPAILPILSSENMTETFASLARAMSNTIRTDSDNHLTLSGQNGTLENYITIRWAWITLPCIVWIMTVAQFGISVVESRRLSAPVWKSSSLAVLSRGVRVGDVFQKDRLVSEFDRSAKSYRAQLYPEDTGEQHFALMAKEHSGVDE